MEVSPEDYYNCTLENAVKLYPFGPVILNFTQPGEHYYYSTVGTQCEYGQKLHITVVAGEGSSGRIYSTTEALGDISASPSHAPAPAPNSAPSAGPIGGLEMVIAGLVSFVAWQFV